MLTDQDIKKLIEVFAAKDDLKDAAANLAGKDDFNNLSTSVDAYAKKADAYFQKMVVLAHQSQSYGEIANKTKRIEIQWYCRSRIWFTNYW